MSVWAKRGSGWTTSWNLNLFSGPTWDIQCGHCDHWFRAKVPVVDHPTVLCTACKTVNRLNVTVRKDDE